MIIPRSRTRSRAISRRDDGDDCRLPVQIDVTLREIRGLVRELVPTPDDDDDDDDYDNRGDAASKPRTNVVLSLFQDSFTLAHVPSLPVDTQNDDDDDPTSSSSSPTLWESSTAVTARWEDVGSSLDDRATVSLFRVLRTAAPSRLESNYKVRSNEHRAARLAKRFGARGGSSSETRGQRTDDDNDDVISDNKNEGVVPQFVHMRLSLVRGAHVLPLGFASFGVSGRERDHACVELPIRDARRFRECFGDGGDDGRPDPPRAIPAVARRGSSPSSTTTTKTREIASDRFPDDPSRRYVVPDDATILLDVSISRRGRAFQETMTVGNSMRVDVYPADDHDHGHDGGRCSDLKSRRSETTDARSRRKKEYRFNHGCVNENVVEPGCHCFSSIWLINNI